MNIYFIIHLLRIHLLRIHLLRIHLLAAHVEQQPIVDVVNAQHTNHNDRIDNDELILLNILKQEDQTQHRNNHKNKVKDRETVKDIAVSFVHWCKKTVKLLRKRHLYN
jgi:hypothetical protein